MVHLTKCSHQRPMTLDYTDLVKHHANGVTLVAFLTKCCLLMLAPVHKSFFGGRLLFETNYKNPSRLKSFYNYSSSSYSHRVLSMSLQKLKKTYFFSLKFSFYAKARKQQSDFKVGPLHSTQTVKNGPKLLQQWVFERILFPIMILKSVTALKS